MSIALNSNPASFIAALIAIALESKPACIALKSKPTSFALKSKTTSFIAALIAMCFILNSIGTLSALGQTGKVRSGPRPEPIDDVNPMIGTTGPSVYDYGGMIPGVATPFGMTHWTAMTRENKISVYSYNHSDKTIQGFLGTHQPAIWMGDYGYISVMPSTGELKASRKLPFTHQDEVSAPNYYSVTMDDGGKPLKAEITATTRAGFLKFTFPASKASHIVVTASRSQKFEGFIQIDPKKQEIVGYNPDRMSEELGPPLPNFKGYFVIQFSKPFASSGTWKDDKIHSGSPQQKGHWIGGYANFPTTEGEEVKVKIGTSFISIEQARDNLRRDSRLEFRPGES